LVVSLLALLVSLSGWGYAATGGTLLIGHENSAGATTRLDSGARHGPTLALKNTGGQAAASFSVKRGIAPFNVGSAVKVGRLNADLLDGADSSGFYQAGSKVADADRLDGIDSSGFYRAGSKVADATGSTASIRAASTAPGARSRTPTASTRSTARPSRSGSRRAAPPARRSGP
jgi:hypothetical protein